MNPDVVQQTVEPMRQIEQFKRLLEIQRKVGSERNIDVLAGLVMREVSELLAADRSSLFLFDPETMQLQATFAEGVAGARLVVPLRIGIVGVAVLTGTTLNIANVYEHPYFNPEIDSRGNYKTHCLLVTPILSAGGLALGGVELINKSTGHFSQADEQAIEAAAARLACLARNGALDATAAAHEIAALRTCVGCERGSVLMLDAPGKQLTALYADEMDAKDIVLNLRLGVAGLVAVTGQSLLIADTAIDPRFDASYDKRTGYHTRTILCVPLKNPSGEVLGVLQAINRRDGQFAAGDVELLESVAAIVAIAVENAILLQEHERQFISLTRALAASIDAKDALTAGHSQHVAEIAIGIGRELGFGEAELDVLRVAAMLHDYGKIGVDDKVLKKNGKLDEAEYGHMKRHAALTFSILDTIHFERKYRSVPQIASSHHETLDGRGYPRGLTANEIPFMAKILTVADIFEALTAERHYRTGMSIDQALGIIAADVGVKFDANVFAGLKRYLARKAG